MALTVFVPVHHEKILEPIRGMAPLVAMLRRIIRFTSTKEPIVEPRPELMERVKDLLEEAAIEAEVVEGKEAWEAGTPGELLAVARIIKERGDILYLSPRFSVIDETLLELVEDDHKDGISAVIAFPGAGVYRISAGLTDLIEEEARSGGGIITAGRISPHFRPLYERWMSGLKRLPREFWQIRSAITLFIDEAPTQRALSRALEASKKGLDEITVEEILGFLAGDFETRTLWPRSLAIETSIINDHPPIYSPLRHLPPVKGRPEFVSPGVVEAVIEKTAGIYGRMVNLHLVGMGEPLLHPGFKDILRTLAEKRVRGGGVFNEVNIETDGRHLDEETVELLFEADITSVMISLDAFDPELYSRVRPGAELEKARRNLEMLVERKARRYREESPWPPMPFIAVTTTLIPELVPHMDDFHAVYTSLEDYARERPRSDPEELRRNFYDEGNMVEYTVIRGASTYAGRLPDMRAQDYTPLRRIPCRRLCHTLFVRTDGTVVPCDRVFETEADIAGNILDDPVEGIWEGMKEARKAHDEKRWGDALPLCEGCGDWYIPVD